MKTSSLFGRFTSIISSPPLISVALFLLAFIPRLADLGRFLTADEFLWVDRSRNFLAGMLNAAYQCTTVVEKWEYAEGLACTLRTGHPGVTTMWTGSFGLVLAWLAEGGRGRSLYEYVTTVSTNPLDASLIAPERFGTVLITSLWVVAVFWLVRRLWGLPIALTAAVLLALDPFHIALSRVIHHDALSTTFMTLAGLTALIYWGEGASRRWLLASGLLAGFGFLSKSPALFLMPYIALVGLWFTVAEVRRTADPFWPTLLPRLLRRTIPDGLLWFAASMMVVFAFWPAMWVIPRETIETVIFIGSKYATGGHAKGNFFLDDISSDPGALFYPLTWLYRTSPLVMVGVVGALVAWGVGLIKGRPERKSSAAAGQVSSHEAFFRYLPLMLLFVGGFYVLMTIGEKKQDRYFLPVYPWLTFMAAGGLVVLVDLAAARLRQVGFARPVFLSALVAGVVLLNGYFVTLHYPYYFTYYNPALGGPVAAAKVLTIGWGEGLDIAADFLNLQMNPMHSRVSSWYESTFSPFYYGPSISYSKEKGKALAGDYVIFYINQLQRHYPDDILFEYIMKRAKPAQVINLQGIDYVWIYPGLGIDHYVQDQTYTGIGSLLAWQWGIGDAPLRPGDATMFEIFWEYLGKDPQEPFFFRLKDAQGRVWAEAQTKFKEGLGGNLPSTQWREGEILYQPGLLYIPQGTPPGQYQLEVGLSTNAPGVANGELLFTLEPGDEWVTVSDISYPQFRTESGFVPVTMKALGDALELLAVRPPAAPVAPGSHFPLEFYWQIDRPMPADAALHLGLMNEAGDAAQAWFNLSLGETFNPGETTWQSGDIVLTRWELELLPDVPAGRYNLQVVLPEDPTQVVSVGELVVE